MKNICCSVGFLFVVLTALPQSWTEAERKKANTCSEVDELEANEKEAIMYINLARLYPKKFAKIELTNYWGPEKYNRYLEDSEYKESLMDQLLFDQEPVTALFWDEELQAFASCFAEEQGTNGHMGHQRKSCPDGNFAECCAYDMETGLDIAMQLLVDHEVPSLGHRENCLNPEYTRVGIKFGLHKKANFCTVIDLY
ncbi:MAG: CAP domain-containing protein [Bacteroidetes bacterium]|nr:CAP domain-containing protein [Bacteroidota bacterium]